MKFILAAVALLAALPALAQADGDAALRASLQNKWANGKGPIRKSMPRMVPSFSNSQATLRAGSTRILFIRLLHTDFPTARKRPQTTSRTLKTESWCTPTIPICTVKFTRSRQTSLCSMGGIVMIPMPATWNPLSWVLTVKPASSTLLRTAP